MRYMSSKRLHDYYGAFMLFLIVLFISFFASLTHSVHMSFDRPTVCGCVVKLAMSLL